MIEPNGPAADAAPRVPRSSVDDFYARGEPLPPSRVGSGIVVAVGVEQCVVLIGDEEIPGVVFLGYPPAVGDVVEVEARGDLLVITALRDVDAFLEGRRSDAQHVVSVDDPGQLLEELHVAGAMTDETAWVLHPDGSAWAREQVDPTAPGIRVRQLAASPGVTLWSTETFPVDPGDVLTLTGAASPDPAGAPAAVSWQLLYGTAEVTEPAPDALDALVVTPGPAVTVDTPETAVDPRDVVVPEVVTTAAGDGRPRTVRVGLYVAGDAAGAAPVAVTLDEVALTRGHRAWPLGSLWLNPDARAGGIPTASHEGAGLASATSIPYTSLNTYHPWPDRKAVVTAPPETGGIVLAFYAASVFLNSAGAVLELSLTADGASSSVARVYTAQANTMQQSVIVQGAWPVEAGATLEVSPQYRYTNAAPATPFQYFRGSLSTLFIPGAVLAGAPAQPPALRYFDGDSWRPDALRPATVALEAASPPTSAKLATSTTVARSSSSLTEGAALTLTATVNQSATGSVTFERAATSAGPWSTVGTATLAAGKASRSWVAVAGSWVFRARYLGSSTRLPSTSAASPAVMVLGALVTRTKTVAAAWVQAFDGDGNRLDGSGADTAVHQGHYSSTHGNRRSLIRFDPALPADAEVTKVELLCSSWAHWYYAAGGTLVVGLHTATNNPARWADVPTAPDKSRHAVATGSWTVNLTGWAATSLKSPGFRGITIGPAPGTSREFYGYAAAGAGPWKLRVTYRTRT